MSKLIESRPEPESAPLVRFPADARWESAVQEPAAHRLALVYYWFLIWRQRWRILTFVLVGTTLATLVALALPKKYRATVVVRVDPFSAPVVGQSSTPNAAQDATLLVTTESKVVTSPAVVLKAIHQLHLGQTKEFAPQHPGPASLKEPGRTDRLIALVTKDISVGQPIETVLLDIGFTCHDPQLAAAAANGLASAFLDQEFRTRAQALMDSSKYMADQLDNMRAQMERDQMKLVRYESTHDLVDPDAKINIYQARLAQINTDFTKIQAQRMSLEADDEIVQSGDLDALLASRRGAVLIPLQERLLSDQRQLNKMAATYGPREPLYRQEAQIVQHDQEVLRRQELHIAAQVGDQYRTAVAEEQLLYGALQREKAAMNAFNRRAIEYRALKAAADGSTKLYYSLQQRIQDADVAAGLRSEDLRIISPARVPDRPVSPRPLFDGALAFLLTALLGAAAAIAAGLMDRTLTTPDQVEMRLGLAAIASLPAVAPKDQTEALGVAQYASRLLPASGEARGAGAAALRQRSAFREAILGLHTAVQFSHPGRLGILAVTSSLPGEGKSTVAAHLAGAFAALGTRTVLVDADLRKPSVHRSFNVPNRRGLSSVLRGQAELEECLTPAFDNLTLLPSGPIAAAPAELLHLGLADVLDHLRTRFDLVLIDCPPVLGFADAPSVANLADGVLVIVKAGATEQRSVSAALRQLRGAHANLLGIVLNRVSEKMDAYYAYHANYYGGYAGEEDDD